MTSARALCRHDSVKARSHCPASSSSCSSFACCMSQHKCKSTSDSQRGCSERNLHHERIRCTRRPRRDVIWFAGVCRSHKKHLHRPLWRGKPDCSCSGDLHDLSILECPFGRVLQAQYTRNETYKMQYRLVWPRTKPNTSSAIYLFCGQEVPIE